MHQNNDLYYGMIYNRQFCEKQLNSGNRKIRRKEKQNPVRLTLGLSQIQNYTPVSIDLPTIELQLTQSTHIVDDDMVIVMLMLVKQVRAC